MMIAESVNNTFGRTVNPKNRNTTSGGSSGGESALIAFKGSPLGVGTDIGTFEVILYAGLFAYIVNRRITAYSRCLHRSLYPPSLIRPFPRP